MIYQERSKFRPAIPFLVSIFLAITTLASVLVGQVVRADPAVDPTDQTGDQQLSDDTDPPVVTTNITDGQILSGTVPIVETVYETNPLEYSITVVDANGSEMIVNGQPIGAVQNPASGDQLTYEWNTTVVPNGTYQVVLKASDQFGNLQTQPVQVTVNNQLTPPVYPPITSELTPIPQQVLAPPHPTVPKTAPPPARPSQPTKVLDAQTDNQLAHRLPQASVPQPELQNLSNVCARFFGVCWYYSVPATVAVSAGALWLYRLRNRE